MNLTKAILSFVDQTTAGVQVWSSPGDFHNALRFKTGFRLIRPGASREDTLDALRQVSLALAIPGESLTVGGDGSITLLAD